MLLIFHGHLEIHWFSEQLPPRPWRTDLFVTSPVGHPSLAWETKPLRGRGAARGCRVRIHRNHVLGSGHPGPCSLPLRSHLPANIYWWIGWSAVFFSITHQVAAQVFYERLSDKCNCSHPGVAASIVATIWLLTWGVQKCRVSLVPPTDPCSLWLMGGKVQIPVKTLISSTHGCAVPSGRVCLRPWTGLKKRNWIWGFLVCGGSVCVTDCGVWDGGHRICCHFSLGLCARRAPTCYRKGPAHENCVSSAHNQYILGVSSSW